MVNFTKSLIVAAAFIAFGSANIAAQAPTTAAPTPPVRSAAKVISIFSDAYTPIAGTTNFNPGWGQATVATTIDVAGSATLSYVNLNYQGTQFGSDVNAAPMTDLHIDVYTTNETVFKVYCISRTAPTEKFVSLTLVQNQWNSFDIPLTDFTSQGMVVSNLFQFKIVGDGDTAGHPKNTVYIDNMYFFDSSATVDTEKPTAFTATKGAVTFSSVELLLNATDNSGAISYEITGGPATVNASGISGVAKSVVINGLNGSSDYTFSVIAKDITGNVADNSPLSVSATTLVAPTAAPVPTVDAAKVISIFSDTYTPALPAIDYNPDWSQSTVVTTVDLGGSATLKYDGLTYQGTDFKGTIDASTMNTMHIDVWTADAASIKITPISTGKEFLVSLTPLTATQWTSFDIPLTSFTGVNMAALYQIKVAEGGGKTVYLDNIYFYDNTATSISANESANGVKLYPNPASDNVTLVATSEISEVVISNLLGQTVKAIAVNALETTINLDQLATGQYFVSVKQANGSVSTQKLIKK